MRGSVRCHGYDEDVFPCVSYLKSRHFVMVFFDTIHDKTVLEVFPCLLVYTRNLRPSVSALADAYLGQEHRSSYGSSLTQVISIFLIVLRRFLIDFGQSFLLSLPLNISFSRILSASRGFLPAVRNPIYIYGTCFSTETESFSMFQP